MSYPSIVYRILIASPSDVDEEREIVSRIIQDWNDLNSFNKKIVILPVRWETHTSPTYGVRPQDSINRQIVDECDLLIGFFWTRIGSPTGEELSGSIEEIKRVSKAGKPVMLYFSKRAKDPTTINIEQLELLNTFKTEVLSIALVESFSSLVDFKDKLSRQIEMKIRELQDKTESADELINLSFIDLATGELQKNKIELNQEYVFITNEKLKEFKNESQSSWNFQNSLKSFLRRKNNMPIVFGVKNNSNRIIRNIHLQVKLKSSLEDGLIIQTGGDNDESDFSFALQQYDLSKENEINIGKLFTGDLIKTSNKSWEFDAKQFTLLPQKLKAISPFLVLFAKENQNIEFNLTLFSENILQSIESICELKITLQKRAITDEELNEVLVKAQEDDDAPF